MVELASWLVVTRALELLRPPTDLLGRLRWVMVWFNLVNAVVLEGFVLFGRGALPTVLGATLGMALFAGSVVTGYRGGAMRAGHDVVLIAGLFAIALALPKAQLMSLVFAYITFAQLYGPTRQVLARVVGVEVVVLGAQSLLSGAAPTGADVGQVVGITMASLFAHLLGRSLGRIQASEARFRSLVQNTSDLVLLIGENGAAKYLSPPAEAVLGHVSGEQGLVLRERLEAGAVEYDAALVEAKRTGRAARVELRLRALDGSVRDCEALVTSQLHDAELEGFVLNVRDVTERKASEAALRAREAALHDAQHEVQIAARIQTALLPAGRAVPGLDLAATMLPASDVGGDYYDIIPLRDGCFIGVGDVSGHGLGAGLVMLMTQSVVSALVGANPNASPREVVIELNRVLHDNIRSRLGNTEHVTFSAFRVFGDGRVLHAGAHEDVLIRRAKSGQVDTVTTRGAWLGAVPDISHAVVQGEFRLDPGDVLLLHTDGVTEARDATKHEFGAERLVRALARADGTPAAALCLRVMEEVEAFSAERTDDRSVVVARYLGPQAG